MSVGVSAGDYRWDNGQCLRPGREVLSGAVHMAVGNGTGWAGSASYLPWPVGGVRGEEVPYLGERLLDSGCYGSPQRGTLWLS